jgi:hypothetical protein
VETVGNFDQHHPDVLGHGHEHLAQGFHLGLLFGGEVGSGQLGDTFHQFSYGGTEELLDLLVVEYAVSEVVDMGDSFYLLVRMDYDEVELERQADDLLASYQWALVEEISMSKKEELKIELNEYGKTLDLLTIE